MTKVFSFLGAVNAAICVMLGAFGAHGLKTKLSAEMLAVFQTGVQYHFYHALGLFAVAFVASQAPDSAMVKWSGWLMQAGIILFSGSLYALSIAGMRWLGPVTPIGGLMLILAWVFLAMAVLQK